MTTSTVRFRLVTALGALALACALMMVAPAEAQQVPSPNQANFVSGPGGALPTGAATGFVPPVVVVPEGSTGHYYNFDPIGAHNVASRELGPDGQPLFRSDVIGGLSDAPVRGVEDLEVGVYEFFCEPHSWMQGVAVVVPNPVGGGLPDPGDLPIPDDLPDPPDLPPGGDPGDPGEPGEPGDGTWPMFGLDLANSRATPHGPSAGELLTYTEAWRYTTGANDDFAGTPVVADGKVFMGSSSGIAVATDASTGEEVWATALRGDTGDGVDITSATVTATVAYHDGVVYVPVSGRAGSPYAPFVAALDADTGEVLWRTFVDDEQPLGDLYGSPVVWETTIENEAGEAEPFAALYIGTSSWDSGASGADELHLGTTVALDLLNDGALLWRTYMFEGGPHTKTEIPVSEDSGKTFDGAAVWSTPTIDTETGKVYVGTGNGYESTHALVDSVVRLDAFTGALEDFYSATETDPWQATAAYRGVDADFGASPQLVEGPNGERWVGAGQKNMHLFEELSGSNAANTMVGLARYHMIDRDTMEEVWVTPVGPGYWWGGITGATAYDGERIYGSTVYGQLFALDKDNGLPVWMTSSGDAGVHMAHTQVANGIVYSADGKGFVSGWDADTGIKLWTRPLTGTDVLGPSAAGVAIVEDVIYTAVGFAGQPGGILAFRPS